MSLLLGLIFAGAAFSAVLYLISVGLSITMGLLGFVNLAHGAFAMLGGYLTLTLISQFHLNYFLALGVSVLAVALFSTLLERYIYRPTYRSGELKQILLTIGVIFVAIASAHYFFGERPVRIPLPSILELQLRVGNLSLSVYRIFLIILGVATFLILRLLFDRTTIGSAVRAMVDNSEMAEGCGINSKLLFTCVFAIGSGLAALGGAAGANVTGLSPTYPLNYLVYVLIIVAVGGAGTIVGPLYAAIILGYSDTIVKTLVPGGASLVIYIITMIALYIWPDGLFHRARVL